MISGGSKGREGRPPAQIPTISCSFWENMAKSYVSAPPESWRPLLWEILDPPLMIVETSLCQNGTCNILFGACNLI